MYEKEALIEWIKHGTQKKAIAQVLSKPMTATEIRKKCMQTVPHLQLRDIWFLMKEFKKRDLVFCLNREATIGKVYFLTDLGREIVFKAFGIRVDALPAGIDWGKYSYVARGIARKHVLIELGTEVRSEGRAAAEIRRGLKPVHWMGLNPTIRALQELTAHGLVECVGVTRKGGHKLYGLTEEGEIMVRELVK